MGWQLTGTLEATTCDKGKKKMRAVKIGHEKEESHKVVNTLKKELMDVKTI